jgi:glycine betaine/proline transport system permease protein
MSRWDRLQSVVNPTLDVIQTMPGFVYLIPVLMLLGIGRVPGLIAVVICAIPPLICFTNQGL